uniref:Zona pellucida sperm-binding protein 3 n=1 Tax=Naja naja TaxID=35670 RepID=A0A8C7E5E9_NAJNA
CIALQFLFLSYLICLLTSANFSDFAREEPVTTLVQNPESEVSSSREDLFPNSWQPIAVQCGEDEMMIQVHRDLFQTGHFIQAKDLSIGPQSCHYFIVNESATLIVFKVELHECIQNLQVLDLMLYNVSLYYKPMSNLTTVKSAEKFPVTCHYSWKNDASSNAIQTTGVLFTSAMSEKGKQYFPLRLMTDDWQAGKNSAIYLLDDDLLVQADIRKGDHLPLHLFINTCMAISKLFLKNSLYCHTSLTTYLFSGFKCITERNYHDVGPSFIIPRTWLETLQFTIPASQIAREENCIYIACHLKVTAAAQEADFLNKACLFNRERNHNWLPIEGSMEICNCCETGDCGSPGKHKSNDSLHLPSQRKESEMEADLVVGPVLIQKAAGNRERDQIGVEEEMLAEGQEASA